MSNEKYPEQGEYDEWLQSNGGDSNAFTDFTNTTYHFKIGNDFLEGMEPLWC